MRELRVLLTLIFILCLLPQTVLSEDISKSSSANITAELEQYNYTGEKRLAEIFPRGTLKLNPAVNQVATDNLDFWYALDQVDRQISIPAGEFYSVKFDPATGQIEETIPNTNFSDLTKQAIARTPRWLRNDLTDILLNYSNMTFLQDMIAECILNAEDPYVDEIAFSLAHLSPDLFLSGEIGWNLDLIIENVEGVYAADEIFNYVQINDYGTSEDDDYWSTVEYQLSEDGEIRTVEIDKYYYYWYIVHPRITDETPSYINPATGGAANPPDGRFWRDYYLNEADEGYETLTEYMDGIDFVYGFLNNTGGADNGAVGMVNQWIQDVMDFGSGSERPIQPVRIYALHLGRCGEHQDITAAAARAVLIPCVGTTSITEDHVWDEFWVEDEWISWEPVNGYINNPLAYQGWGKQFPALFNWRPDGWIWPVTERYHSETTTLEVMLTDADGRPVDGVEVRLLSEYLGGGLQIASCVYSDSDGRCIFPIGGNRNIYLNIRSELGNDPGSGNTGILVIEGSDTNEEYLYEYQFETSMEINEPTLAQENPNPTNHYGLELEFSVSNEASYGQIFSHADFVAVTGAGAVNYFICDETNYQLFVDGQDFEVLDQDELVAAGYLNHTFPTDESWYFVVDNSSSCENYQRLNLSTSYIVDSEYAVENEPEIAADFKILGNYPNPFNGTTNITFNLPAENQTMLRIFNINGQEVISKNLGLLSTGLHKASVNLHDQASGTYIYRLESGNYAAESRMLLLR